MFISSYVNTFFFKEMTIFASSQCAEEKRKKFGDNVEYFVYLFPIKKIRNVCFR